MVIPDGFAHCEIHNVYFIPKPGHAGCGECRKMEKIKALRTKISTIEALDHREEIGVGVDVDGDGEVDVVVNKKTKRTRKPKKKVSPKKGK
jgi:hypothetical protein